MMTNITLQNLEFKNYLATLRKKQQINNLFETAVDDVNYGNVPMAPREKTAHEILQDTVEVQQRVRTILKDLKLFDANSFTDVINGLTQNDYIFIFTNEELIKKELLGKYKVLSAVDFREFLTRLKKKIEDTNRVSDLPSITKKEVEDILKDMGLDRLSDAHESAFRERLKNLGYDPEDIDEILDEYTARVERHERTEPDPIEMNEVEKNKSHGIYYPYIRLSDERLLNVLYRLDGTIRDKTDPVFSQLRGPVLTTTPIDDLKKELYYRITEKDRAEATRINAKEIKDLFIRYKNYNEARRVLYTITHHDTDSEPSSSKSSSSSSSLGFGLKPKKKLYTSFGKKDIHLQHLEKNIVNVKYPHRHFAVPNYPIKVSDDLKDFFQDVIENGKVNDRLFKKLSKEDQKIFVKTASRCGMKEYDAQQKKYEKEEDDRFNLLKGEIMAGNDNKQIIEEFKDLLIQFMDCGKIKAKNGNEILKMIYKF